MSCTIKSPTICASPCSEEIDNISVCSLCRVKHEKMSYDTINMYVNFRLLVLKLISNKWVVEIESHGCTVTVVPYIYIHIYIYIYMCVCINIHGMWFSMLYAYIIRRCQMRNNMYVKKLMFDRRHCLLAFPQTKHTCENHVRQKML